MRKNTVFVLGVLAVLLTFGMAQQVAAQTGTWDVTTPDGKWSDGHDIASLKDMVKQGILKRDTRVYNTKVGTRIAGDTELASLFSPFIVPKGFVGTWHSEHKEAALRSMGIRLFYVIEIGENGTFAFKQKVFVNDEVGRIGANGAGIKDETLSSGVVASASDAQITCRFVNIKDVALGSNQLRLSGQSLVDTQANVTFAKGDPKL